MTALIPGIAGFVLFFVYDINSMTRQSALLHRAFAAGLLLVAIATILGFVSAWRSGGFGHWASLPLLLLGALSFIALIYSLFFALPFDETYREAAAVREAYTGGVYALCRHPGVLCFWLMYLFWGAAALPSGFWKLGVLLSLLNTGYAWFQDRVTFPKMFSNYASYRTQAPFLLPTAGSIRRAVKTRGAPNDKEVGM